MLQSLDRIGRHDTQCFLSSIQQMLLSYKAAHANRCLMLLIFTQVAVAFQQCLSFPTLQSSKYNTRQLTYLWRGNLLCPFTQRVNRSTRTRGCAENPHSLSMFFEAAFGNPFHSPRNMCAIANVRGVISPQQRVSLFSALLCRRVFHHTQE